VIVSRTAHNGNGFGRIVAPVEADPVPTDTYPHANVIIRLVARHAVPTQPFPRTGLAIILILAALASRDARSQYAWDEHFGSQPTGFEKRWFGNWEIEMVPMRGMIDRGWYESESRAERGVRQIRRKVVRNDKAGTGKRVVHESLSLVNADGRITATVYFNPQTRKQVQRESFKYDESGRLLEWRPVLDPAEVAIASIAQTAYPGRLPFGRYQTFRYYEDGTLKEWRACTPGRDRRSQQCDDAYVTFDTAGRITGFIWLELAYTLERDAGGNVARVVATNRKRKTTLDLHVHYDDIVIRERFATEDSTLVENFTTRDSRGRVVQYKMTSPDTPGYYSTITWDYDAAGRITGIRRGLDTYAFSYDERGRLTTVQQSVLPLTINREYDERGRLSVQSPPLEYNRYDLVEVGKERFVYTEDGLPASITAVDTDGNEVGVVTFEYEYSSSARATP
jgi:YD repeat-containing protein